MAHLLENVSAGGPGAQPFSRGAGGGGGGLGGGPVPADGGKKHRTVFTIGAAAAGGASSGLRRRGFNGHSTKRTIVRLVVLARRRHGGFPEFGSWARLPVDIQPKSTTIWLWIGWVQRLRLCRTRPGGRWSNDSPAGRPLCMG